MSISAIKTAFTFNHNLPLQFKSHFHLPKPVQRNFYGVKSLKSTIIPISKNKIFDLNLVSRDVTSPQWNSYWGVNSKERTQRILESLLVAYAGAWFAWFVSFMSGGLAPFIGTFLIFNWLYSPWLNAKRRNKKFWDSEKNYAIFLGEIFQLNKLKRRSGKTIGAAYQEYLQIFIRDENDRELEIITQWQDSYRRLKTGMDCKSIIQSSSTEFNSLDLITDIFIPDCNVWCGDYPYLNKLIFKNFIASFEQQLKGSNLFSRKTVDTISSRKLPDNLSRVYKKNT